MIEEWGCPNRDSVVVVSDTSGSWGAGILKRDLLFGMATVQCEPIS